MKFDTDIAYCEDLLFIIEYLEKCNSFSYTHLCLYNYYIYENSASNFKKWNKKNITVAKARKKIINILNKYDFSVYKDYYLHYFYCLNEIYHKYDDGAKYKKDVDNSYSFIMSNNYSLITKCKVFFKRYCFSVICLLKLFFKE